MKIISHAVIGIAAVLVLSSCTNDILDASYDTHAEAIADGAVKRGWIPVWVPQDATEIREVHDVDTNESALSLKLPAGSRWTPPTTCRRADGGEFPEAKFSRSWLPENMDGYTFFSCPSGIISSAPIIEVVAIRRDGQHVLHWRVFPR